MLIPVGITRARSSMNADEPLDDAAVSDAALLRRFIEGSDAERAEMFLAIYGRFRCTVRGELEGAGLGIMEAEERVGAVFGRTLDHLRSRGHAGAESLRDCLMDAAREVARHPTWRPGG